MDYEPSTCERLEEIPVKISLIVLHSPKAMLQPIENPGLFNAAEA